MRHFVVKDNRTGEAVRWGSAAADQIEHQALPGERVEPLDGPYVPPEKAPVAPDYAEQRYAAYPRIEDQLDALWKGGTALADMQAAILAVKSQYPKPGQ